MAKLSAHGTEVARVKYAAKLGTDTDYEVTLSFRSDGHIMRKLKALNIHPCTSPFHGTLLHECAPPHHDYGWKLYQKVNRAKLPKDTTLLGFLKNEAVRRANAAGDRLIDSTI